MFHYHTIFLVYCLTKVLLVLLVMTEFSKLTAAYQRQEIEYRVISAVQENVKVVVVIDDKVFQLSQSSVSPLIHTGIAPSASVDYFYAKTKDGSLVEREYMTRPPNIDDSDDFPYQFYNRSRDRWDTASVPKVLDPLPVINRIDSDLHIYGEISTIHIIGNQTEIDQLHTNVFDDFEVMTDMVYIRYIKCRFMYKGFSNCLG